MNLPNRLTLARIALVPVVMIFILYRPFGEGTYFWSALTAAALFLIATVTDFFDGHIARKRNMSTDFGKLMDPIADKFLTIGALIAFAGSEMYADIRWLTVWAAAIVFFRELGVTSLRLIANTSEGLVISAAFIGKLKTVFQSVAIMTLILEPYLITAHFGTVPYLLTYITMGIMLLLTVISGVLYFKDHWAYINPKG